MHEWKTDIELKWIKNDWMNEWWLSGWKDEWRTDK